MLLEGKLMASTDSGDASLIPEDYRAQLLQLAPEPTHIMQMATIVPAPTGTVTWPRLVQTDSSEYGGVSVSWISEGAEKPETEPTFEQETIDAHEVAAYTEITHRLLARSVLSLENILTRLFRGAVQHALDTAFIGGSGTGQPLGIINTTGIHLVNRTVANAIRYDDFVNLEHALRVNHRAGGHFVMADAILQAIKLRRDSDNRPLWVPSVAGGPPNTIIGYGYTPTHRLTAYSDGDVVFGDWSQYIIAMEQDVVVKRSDHYKFRHNRAAFTVYAVVGGKCVQPRAFSILNDTTS